jgi:hypothetical protein
MQNKRTITQRAIALFMCGSVMEALAESPEAVDPGILIAHAVMQGADPGLIVHGTREGVTLGLIGTEGCDGLGDEPPTAIFLTDKGRESLGTVLTFMEGMVPLIEQAEQGEEPAEDEYPTLPF